MSTFTDANEAKRCITRLRRRLALWELQHLRAHAADLAERLEEAERRANDAEDQATFWWDGFMRLEEGMRESHPESAIGLTQAGNLVVVHTGEPVGAAGEVPR